MPMEDVAKLALAATLTLPGPQRVSRVREAVAGYRPASAIG